MKSLKSYKEIKGKILEAVEVLSLPIISTLGPKGSNVILEDPNGEPYVTNDGVTIANQIEFEDEVQNNISRLVINSALKTNTDAGDGTTTSILLARALIKEGFKLLDNGWNPMRLKNELDKAEKLLRSSIKKLSHKAKGEKDLRFVASVSSNNDEEITENVTKAVKSSGQDGLVILEPNSKDETEVKTEEGFLLESGMFSPQLSTIPGKLMAQYDNVKVLVTDKRVYYPDEVISILDPVAKARIKDIVIFASDFIGQAPNVFIANHVDKRMNILLVKADEKTLDDLASYLDVTIVSDKQGKLTTNLTLGDFADAKKIISDSKKTLIVSDPNVKSKERVKMIKEEIEKTKDAVETKELEKRLARMTSGTVTIYVGGKTAPELREKMYRYEDSINATKSAQKEGYVIGGGLTLYQAFKDTDWGLTNKDICGLIEKVSKAPLQQIAINCDLHFPTLLEKVDNGLGYNAVAEGYDDLHKAGIIEPLKVLTSAFKNAISVAGMILSSKFVVSVVKEKETKKQHEK